MNVYLHLRSALQTSPAVRLLRSPHAAMLLSFLQRTFKQQHAMTVPRGTLIDCLRDHLETLRELGPDQYPQSAEAYLESWTRDDTFLRMFYETGSDDPVVELTPEAERALQWIEDLSHREFIGTESRFQRIFELLEELVTGSEEDPKQRIRQLEAQLEKIEREIERIKVTGHVDTLTETQIRERFLDAVTLSRSLLADFREVEQNFKQLTRQVQQDQLRDGVAKGEIVGHVLDADDALKSSHQGQSFYAFWRFLLSPERQEALERFVAQVHELPEVASLHAEGAVLRRMKVALIEAGEKVIRSNHRLADQLRRLLDERNLAENRRVMELIGEIKQLALLMAEDPPSDSAFMEIDDRPEVEAPMERPLWSPSLETGFDEATYTVAEAEEALDLSDLFSPFAIDPREISGRVDRLLEQRTQVTLHDIIERHPVDRGLAEIVAYFSLAGSRQGSLIDQENRERILVSTFGDGLTPPRFVSVPRVIFRRE